MITFAQASYEKEYTVAMGHTKQLIHHFATSGQLMPGVMHTDTSNTIEAITALDYAKGDKVTLDGGDTYEIVQVNDASFNEFGRLRGIRRSAKILQLT